ncbi:MAG TPA: hypothetical protein VGJ09_19505 [Bryobacteraceae bacterium]
MARTILLACTILGAVAMATMIATVFIWMTVPDSIVYRQSSPARSEVYSVEVQEHGHSYFLTPAQKASLDGIRNRTPIVMFAAFATAFLAIVVGAAARLKIKSPPA